MASVSTLFATGEHWEAPVLDYVGFQAVAPWDGSALNTRHYNRAVLCGASLRSPVVGAFMLPGDASIYIGHSPSEYAPDALQASPFDNALVVLVGNDLTSVTPLVLHESSTYRCTDATVYDLAYLIGANGHIAAPLCTNTRPRWLARRTLRSNEPKSSACCPPPVTKSP